MTTVYLEGVICSCHDTEHDLGIDRDTLLRLLEPKGTKEDEHTCDNCSYRFRVSTLKLWGSLWLCRDREACHNRKRQMEALRKLATEA